jgi:anti-sigma-K factor RskA
MRLSRDAIHALAGEYVVGTLRGRARRRFEAIARADPGTAAVLRRWEEALTPLANRIAPLEPPARVWRSIEGRIAGAERGAGFWSSVAFWRGFGLVAGGLATVLFAAFIFFAPQRGPQEAAFVAVLTSPDSVPRVVVSLPTRDVLQVRVVQPWKGVEGKALELWALPKDGKPRSLGLFRNAGDTRLVLTPDDKRLAGMTALAVSLEPSGGSPTGQPTGPVLCSGAVAALKKT